MNADFTAWLANFQTTFYDNLIYEDRWLLMLRGLGTTIYVAFFALVLGTILGAMFCLFRISKNKLLNSIGSFYVYIIRGTPSVIQLLLIFYGVFGAVNIPRELAAIIALAINSAAYIAEIMRGGIMSVNIGQLEAGRSLGLSHWQTMWRIIFPQALKNMLPTYTSEVIVLLKETAIVGFVALKDITGFALSIRSRTYSNFFLFIVAAILYLMLTTVLSLIFTKMERRLRESDRR